MATKLSQAAIKLLEGAGCSEVADDYVILGSTDLRILLSRRAVEDINAQARELPPGPNISECEVGPVQAAG